MIDLPITYTQRLKWFAEESFRASPIATHDCDVLLEDITFNGTELSIKPYMNQREGERISIIYGCECGLKVNCGDLCQEQFSEIHISYVCSVIASIISSTQLSAHFLECISIIQNRGKDGDEAMNRLIKLIDSLQTHLRKATALPL